ncbi:pumilio homolog 12 [Lactuca sativa]|uniref:pumilio homolog 12 n=1 Tax=Lactuca sativa TaxID=4236 RepID=UPI0022AE7F4E|nr:pumilio homolog 12 [Lactuca sativa]
MENGSRSKRDEEFDWLFISQNPTNSFQPSPATVNGGSGSSAMGSTSSMRPVNHNDGFLVDHGVLSFQNKQQQQQQQHQQLPAAMGVNPVRSILNHRDRYPPLLPDFIEYNPYEYDHSCNSCDQLYCAGDIIPGFPSYGYRSPLSGFPETQYDRNLEIDFSRFNISSPNHHQIPPYLPSPSTLPASDIRNNSFVYTQLRAPVTRNNTGCNDICCNPHRRDQNHSLVVENTNRSRDWISAYELQNPNNNNPFSRQQESRRPRFPASLKDMRGLIYLVAKDQEGCQFLQNKCEEGKSEEVEMIFNEIKDHIRELMVDASMNYLAQKLFKAINERQLTHIVVTLISDNGNLTSICLNSHGTRAMQKLIELLTTSEQRSLIVSALKRITVTLSKNTNGHHVIQNCLKLFHVNECQPILDVVADNCIDIATDKSGCCVLQQCVSLAVGVTKDRLISPIIENSLHLSEHPYGNYVVQHILGMQIPEATGEILRRLSGNFVSLGMNKFASNVVEKFLKDASDDVVIAINREFINSHNFLSLITHPFGNYVAQSALHTAKDGILETMINKIQKEYASLHSHPHGKRVLALARSSRPKVPVSRRRGGGDRGGGGISNGGDNETYKHKMLLILISKFEKEYDFQKKEYDFQKKNSIPESSAGGGWTFGGGGGGVPGRGVDG